MAGMKGASRYDRDFYVSPYGRRRSKPKKPKKAAKKRGGCPCKMQINTRNYGKRCYGVSKINGRRQGHIIKTPKACR